MLGEGGAWEGGAWEGGAWEGGAWEGGAWDVVQAKTQGCKLGAKDRICEKTGMAHTKQRSYTRSCSHHPKPGTSYSSC